MKSSFEIRPSRLGGVGNVVRLAWTVLAGVCLIAQNASAVDIGAELGRIQSEFEKGLTSLGPMPEKAAVKQVLESRTAALRQLTATAEKENTMEHVVLSQLYGMIGEPDGVIRHAQARLADAPDDVGMRGVLVESLAAVGRKAEALAEFRKLVESPLDKATAPTFLQAVSVAILTVNGAARSGDATSRREFSALLDSTLDKLKAFKTDDAGLRARAEALIRTCERYRKNLGEP